MGGSWLARMILSSSFREVRTDRITDRHEQMATAQHTLVAGLKEGMNNEIKLAISGDM